MNSRFPKKILPTLLVGGWLFAASWGTWRLAAYSLSPGVRGVAPIDWPADTSLARDRVNFTAVVALHPECPCSAATVEELDSIVAQSGGRLRVHALFVELPGLPEAADRSELWQRARRIAGIELHKDSDGLEARRFGARTSGETRLYRTDGRLQFSGGITAARGHVGENPGEAAIVDLIAHRTSPSNLIQTPVFGCALWSEPSAKP